MYDSLKKKEGYKKGEHYPTWTNPSGREAVEKLHKNHAKSKAIEKKKKVKPETMGQTHPSNRAEYK